MRNEILSLAVMAVLFSAGAFAQVDDGIHPISDTEFQRARKYGEQGVTCSLSPYQLRAQLMRTGVIGPKQVADDPSGPKSVDSVAKAAGAAPFTITIISPTVRTCLAATESKRRSAPFTLTVEDANKEQVVIRVQPGSNVQVADSVERVVLKRNSQVIQPLASKLEQTTLQNGSGASRQFTTGTFQFKISDFTPVSPLTVVIDGTAKHLEWTLLPPELARLN